MVIERKVQEKSCFDEFELEEKKPLDELDLEGIQRDG